MTDTLLDELQKRVRELRCIHGVATILGDQEQPLDRALRRAVEQIPPAMRYREAASAAISYADTTVTTERYAEVGPRLEAEFQMSSGSPGRLTVRYDPERMPAGPEGLFQEEEQALLESVASLLQSHFRTREHQARTERERDRFMTLFRTGPMAMALSDAETSSFVDVNDRWCEVTGYEREELLGRGAVSLGLSDPDRRKELRRELEERGFVSNFRVQFRRRDGEVRDAFGSVQMIELDGRNLFFSILHDVTEQVRMEEERARMAERRNALERLGSIGELAGGVAHDINNLLLPILVNVELTLPDASEDLGTRLLEIREAALQGRDLTRKLLTFARKQTLQKERVDLGDIVRSAEPVLRRMVSDSVDVDVAVAGDFPLLIDADPALIEQVLVNLVANARDAVGSRGHIRVLANVRDVTDAGDYGVTGAAGRFAYLTVEDDGAGIPEGVRDKIFEPFFTTKHEAMGTGLGLSSVLGVVEQHEGHIELVSTQGGGARFSIGLPVAEPATTEGVRGPAGTRPLDQDLGAGRTALVVEDDDAVRRVTGRVLRSYGFDVREAPDGPAALELLRSQSDGIDVIISDMVMPGMTGVELGAELERTASEVPILFVSGYSWSALADQGIDPGAVRVLQKPFSPTQLVAAVSQLIPELDGSR